MNTVLIVGLGNPGKDYAKTRHNIGWMVLDELHKQGSWGPWMWTGGNSITSCGVINGHNVVLMKPTTMMNSSGNAVGAFMSAVPNVGPVIVIHDEMDIPFADVSSKFSGGAAGHNGVKDVIRALDTQDFHRIRCGIGRPHGKSSVIQHVLGPFDDIESESLPVMVQQAVLNTNEIVTNIR